MKSYKGQAAFVRANRFNRSCKISLQLPEYMLKIKPIQIHDPSNRRKKLKTKGNLLLAGNTKDSKQLTTKLPNHTAEFLKATFIFSEPNAKQLTVNFV